MLNSKEPVSLGCGTLILIAIIVAIFGNSKKEHVQELRELRAEVKQLTEEVKNLSTIVQNKQAEAPIENANDAGNE